MSIASVSPAITTKQPHPENETETGENPSVVLTKMTPTNSPEREDQGLTEHDEIKIVTSQRKCFSLSAHDSPDSKTKPKVTESMEFNELIAEAAQLINPEQFPVIHEDENECTVYDENNDFKSCKVETIKHLKSTETRDIRNSQDESIETVGDIVSATTGASDVSDDVIPLPTNQSKRGAKHEQYISAAEQSDSVDKERVSQSSVEIENNTRRRSSRRKDKGHGDVSSVQSETNTEASISLLQPSNVVKTQICETSSEDKASVSREMRQSFSKIQTSSQGSAENVSSSLDQVKKGSVSMFDPSVEGDSPNDIFAASELRRSSLSGVKLDTETEEIPQSETDLVENVGDIKSRSQDIKSLPDIRNDCDDVIETLTSDVINNSDVSMDSEASGPVVVSAKRRSLKRKSSDGHTNVEDGAIPHDDTREFKKRKSGVEVGSSEDKVQMDTEPTNQTEDTFGVSIGMKEMDSFISIKESEDMDEPLQDPKQSSHNLDETDALTRAMPNDLSNETETDNYGKTQSCENKTESDRKSQHNLQQMNGTDTTMGSTEAPTKKRRLRRSVIPPLAQSHPVTKAVTYTIPSEKPTSHSAPIITKTVEIRLTQMPIKHTHVIPRSYNVNVTYPDIDPSQSEVGTARSLSESPVAPRKRRSNETHSRFISDTESTDEVESVKSDTLSRLQKQGIVSDDNSDNSNSSDATDSPIRKPKRKSTRLRGQIKSSNHQLSANSSLRRRKNEQGVSGCESSEDDLPSSMESWEKYGKKKSPRLVGRKFKPVVIDDQGK